MSKSVGVAVLGGTGYAAGELIRLLLNHPDAELLSVVSSSSAGNPIFKSHPQLRGHIELSFDAELDMKKFAGYREKILFSGLPHGVSAGTLAGLEPELAHHQVRLIDLAGDFRLKDREQRLAHYPDTREHSSFAQRFTYSLPELLSAEQRKALRSAVLVCCPGCLASTSILALAPLVSYELDGAVVIDAKTGTSGAGRSTADTFHHPLRHASSAPYKILQHRHEPEIAEVLGQLSSTPLTTFFVPHLLPVSRGILVTAYLTMRHERDAAEARAAAARFYAEAPFVQVVDAPPELASVVGSNHCHLSVTARGRQVVLAAATDNLLKGAAGQAVQNMNLMCGLGERSGLTAPALGIL